MKEHGDKEKEKTKVEQEIKKSEDTDPVVACILLLAKHKSKENQYSYVSRIRNLIDNRNGNSKRYRGLPRG